jgi:hypothetical protein
MKKYIRLALGAVILGGISSLWLLLQSNADDPNPKPTNKVFLPFVTTDDSATNAASLTAKTIQIAQGNAGGQIDAFTYFIPYETNQLDDQFISFLLLCMGTALSSTMTNGKMAWNLISPCPASSPLWLGAMAIQLITLPTSLPAFR